MLSLRTIYDVCRASGRAGRIEQVNFLTRADVIMTHLARNAGHCIQQGTQNDIWAQEIGVELGLNPTSDFLYDLGADYVYHLKNTDPKAFHELLRSNLGEEAVSEYKQTGGISLPFNVKVRHPVDYYGFLQQLSGWKKLDKVMSSMGIKAELFADAPENGRHPLFVALTSITGTPLRILVQNPNNGLGEAVPGNIR
jgi:hypothetical protein